MLSQSLSCRPHVTGSSCTRVGGCIYSRFWLKDTLYVTAPHRARGMAGTM